MHILQFHPFLPRQAYKFFFKYLNIFLLSNGCLKKMYKREHEFLVIWYWIFLYAVRLDMADQFFFFFFLNPSPWGHFIFYFFK